MEDLISDVSDIDFYIETQLEQQIGVQPLPYPGMDKSGSGVCNFFLRGACHLGPTCPFRHIKGDRTIVCKHWLRGLCKKGDDCEFLHEYDMSKMPECYFFTKFGQCLNKECPFLHIDPNSKIKQCEWYDRGFCRNGPACKMRHVRRVACANYLNGFCLEGPDCQFAHPRWGLPQLESSFERRQAWVCRHCGERGHKVQFCFKLTEEERRVVLEQMAARKAETQLLSPKLNPQLKQPHANSIEGGTPTPAGIPRGFPQPAVPPSRVNQRSGGRRPYHQRLGTGYSHRGPYNRHRQRRGSQDVLNRSGQAPGGEDSSGSGPRPLSEVTCFKCGEKGHYANACPKGHLAFLSKADQEELKQQQQGDQPDEQDQQQLAEAEAPAFAPAVAQEAAAS